MVKTWDEFHQSKQDVIPDTQYTQTELLHSLGFHTLSQAPPGLTPMEEKESLWKRALRWITPWKKDDTEPSIKDVLRENEDARLSYIREKQFVKLYQEQITENITLPTDYKEPTSFIGQFLEGVKAGWYTQLKAGFGYAVESLGHGFHHGMVEWGQRVADQAMIDYIKRPELAEPEDLKPFFEGGVVDRRWWGRTLGTTVPFIATTTATATLGGLTGGPLGAVVGGFSSSAILEKGGAYKRYIDDGMPPDIADDYSTVYGAIAGAIENAMGISPAKIGMNIVARGGQRAVATTYKQWLISELPKIGLNVLRQAAEEGGEEVAQSLAQDLIFRFWNENADIISDNLLEEFAGGFAAGLAFGGATSLRIPRIQSMNTEQAVAVQETIHNLDNTISAMPKMAEPAKLADFPMDTYQLDLLQEINMMPELPKMESGAFDWSPPTVGYQNPYTRVMTRVMNNIRKTVSSKAPRIVKESQIMDVTNLLKERQRVYDGLSRKYYEDIVKPMTKLNIGEKQQIGQMIFKSIDIPAEYQETIKNIDTHIGQLGQGIVNIDKDLIMAGYIADPAHSKRASEIKERLGTLNIELKQALKELKVSMKDQKAVVNKIKQTEKQLAEFENEFSREFDIFLAGDKDIVVERPATRQLGTLPDSLVGLAESVKNFNTFKDLMASDVGIEVDAFYERGDLERAGFKTRQSFFRYVKSPYRYTPAKTTKRTVAGDIKKLQKIAKSSEKLALQKDILRDIDLLSVDDSLIFLESIINDLNLEKGELATEMRSLRKELEKGLPLLSEDVWMQNLGKYARTLYVKFDDNGKPIINAKSSLSKKGVIDRSIFKHKMTDAEWGANALQFDGVSLAEIKLYTEAELSEIGRGAKESYGWVYQGDYVLAQTFQAMSKAYATRLFQKAIIENNQLFTADYKTAEKMGFVPIRDLLPRGVEKDIRVGPLNGGYVHPGLKEEITSMTMGNVHEAQMALFREPLSWWKAFRVAGNPATVARNFMSGAVMQTDMAGYPVWLPKNSKRYMRAVNSYLTRDALYQELRNAGQYGSDYFTVEIASDEMSRLIEKAEVANNAMDSYAKHLFAQIGDKAKDAKSVFNYYGHIDHLQRTYLALCAKEDGASNAQAVHFANKWQLDYRFVPKMIEYLRDGLPGWLYPFLSFYTLMAPRVAEVLFTRPWVLMKYPILISVANTIAATMLGADDDEIENAKPEFLVGGSYVLTLPRRDKDGNIQFLNLDYIFPFGGPNTAFMDWDQVLLMLKNPGMMSATLALLNNYDNFTDSKIFNNTDLDDVKRAKIAKYIIRNFGPGFVTHALNIYDIATKKTIPNPLEKETPSMQAIARSMGISIYSGGFSDAFWKIRNLQTEIKDIEWAIAEFARDPNLPSAEKQARIMEARDEIIRRAEQIQIIASKMPRPIRAPASNNIQESGIAPWPGK